MINWKINLLLNLLSTFKWCLEHGYFLKSMLAFGKRNGSLQIFVSVCQEIETEWEELIFELKRICGIWEKVKVFIQTIDKTNIIRLIKFTGLAVLIILSGH
jgi:hypothetical protein